MLHTTIRACCLVLNAGLAILNAVGAVRAFARGDSLLFETIGATIAALGVFLIVAWERHAAHLRRQIEANIAMIDRVHRSVKDDLDLRGLEAGQVQ
jgi:hypothetical protein